MPEELKTFMAILADWGNQGSPILSRTFHIEDENDALEIAEDLARLNGNEQSMCSRSKVRL